jgi:hypothetical protein
VALTVVPLSPREKRRARDDSAVTPAGDVIDVDTDYGIDVGPVGQADPVAKRRAPELKRCPHKDCEHLTKVYSSSSLSRHQKLHTTDYKFKCVDCNKAFRQSTNLTRHRDKLHKIDALKPQVLVADDRRVHFLMKTASHTAYCVHVLVELRDGRPTEVICDGKKCVAAHTEASEAAADQAEWGAGKIAQSLLMRPALTSWTLPLCVC